MKLVLSYALLALIATVANIGAQDLAIRLYSGVNSVVLSIAIGTGVGLVVKYALDKRWIFLDAYETHAAELRKIVIYGASGSLGTAAVQIDQQIFDRKR